MHGAGGSQPLGIRSAVAMLVLFLLFLACLLAWVAATPMYGAPDEPAHAVKAFAVVHGDHGTRNEAGPLAHRVPPAYTDRDVCYAFDGQRPANCLHLSSAGPDRLQTTKAESYPPFFYLLVGWPTLLTRRILGLYLMRAVAAGWVALLMTVAFHSILLLPKRRPVLVGIALATTPAVFFFGASVNPSGVAIAAGIAVWTGGFALLRSDILPRARLHVALASACAPLCVLLLVRRDSLLWAGLIALSLAAITPRGRWKELATSRAARWWAAAILAAILLQLATGGHGTAALVGNAAGGSASGAWKELGQDIREIGGGVLGWRDTPMPTLVYVVFIGGTVSLAAFSLWRAPRRLALAVAGITILVVTAPLAIGAYRYPYFQGRYLLPLSVGVPLLAGLGLSEDTRSKEWPSSVVITFLVLAATAHLIGFAQVLRRFTAGRNGGWFFAHASAWRPPVLGATPLAVFYAAAIFALVAWMCLLGLAPEHEPRTSVDGEDVLPATAPRRRRPLSVER